jgi:DNA-binding NarL/FixJ family response regulator
MVEDQPICRLGISMTLAGSDLGYEMVGEATNVAEAISLLTRHSNEIDLILLDYMLPDGTGMDVVKEAKRLCPDAKIVIFSGEAGGATIKQLMEAGVNGFMSKSVGSEEIALVLDSVMQGRDYTGEAHMRIENDLKADYEIMKSLTRREMELISLCATGLNTKQLAEEMCVTPHSIENMKSALFGKIGVKSTNELILFAFRVGLVN